MSAQGILNAFLAVANAVFVMGGIYLYLALARQVSARLQPEIPEGTRTFGIPEVILAICLAALFLVNAAAANSGKLDVVLSAKELAA
ncbi:MAG: hypothetical protein H0T11_08080, partial [Chthoniobacterales bacterium]|nr:hypothetical protein [Chthoniobacterales bacterium]